ncbi:MAG: TonB family protein [Candidatus Tectomicrobia bacterium]|uniref:TonB family protein n=1 Tax=Tectimicrobiota bacterium TaxID=2528274 RepID=A0A932CMB3_UNCTE|nr:TonB family protein [Candidatus Tectomicrobia bacterium]
MAGKRDPGGKWIYVALSLLFHLVLFLGLSWVILEDPRDLRDLRSLPPRLVRVQVMAEMPLEIHPAPKIEGPPNKKIVPVRPVEGARAGLRPRAVAPSSPARRRRSGPAPAKDTTPVSVLPGPLASAPAKGLPQPAGGGEALPVARNVDEGSPPDPRVSGAQEALRERSPAVPVGSMPTPEEGKREPAEKRIMAGAAGSGGEAGGAPPGKPQAAEAPATLEGPSSEGAARSAVGQEKEKGDPAENRMAAIADGGHPSLPRKEGKFLSLAQPRYRENDRPIYPRLAQLKGYEGKVLLEVEVRADGRVGGVVIKESSNHKVLDEAALKAVRKWRYSPARRGGTPVASRVLVPIYFELAGENH